MMDAEIDKRRQDYLHLLEQKYQAKRKWERVRAGVDAILQFIIIVGAIAVAFLINIPQAPSAIPTVITVLIAIAAGLLSYYKFGERSRIDRFTARTLRDEIEDYTINTGFYRNLDQEKAFDLFREKTKVILHENMTKMYTIALQERDQKGKPSP